LSNSGALSRRKVFSAIIKVFQIRAVALSTRLKRFPASVRSRTAAKGDSMGLVVRTCNAWAACQGHWRSCGTNRVARASQATPPAPPPRNRAHHRPPRPAPAYRAVLDPAAPSSSSPYRLLLFEPAFTYTPSAHSRRPPNRLENAAFMRHTPPATRYCQELWIGGAWLGGFLPIFFVFTAFDLNTINERNTSTHQG